MLRPRTLGAVGLAFALTGAAAAIALALAGPRSLSGAGLASMLLTLAFRGAVIVGAVGAVVGVVLDRWFAVLMMLAAAAFFLGYVGGYFVAQGLGLWYPTS
jgi:hypothetical protein